jgi:hypothetical protein
LLIVALISSAPAANAPAVASSPLLEYANAVAVNSAFHEEFRMAYGSALWTMMVLRWCDGRWNRPVETAKAEARLKAINAKAVRRGLKPQMEQAAEDNARQMAVMRLDVHCSAGFDRSHANADRALAKTERLPAGS